MQHWYIKFTNGYTKEDFNMAKSVLIDINFFRGSKVAEKIRAKVDDVLCDIMYDDDRANVEALMQELSAYLEGVMDILEDGELLARMVGYLYDALSLAEIVPYADRLN